MSEDMESIQADRSSNEEQNSISARFDFRELELSFWTKEVIVRPVIKAIKIIKEKKMAIRILFLLRIAASLSSLRSTEESMELLISGIWQRLRL